MNSVCVVCACMSACLSVCAPICIEGWKSEADFGCLPLLLSTLYSEAESLIQFAISGSLTIQHSPEIPCAMFTFPIPMLPTSCNYRWATIPTWLFMWALGILMLLHLLCRFLWSKKKINSFLPLSEHITTKDSHLPHNSAATGSPRKQLPPCLPCSKS